MQTQVWHAAKKIAKSSSGILERKKGNCRIHQPISFFAVINFWPFLKNVLLTFVLANPSLLVCFTISVIFFLCVCVCFWTLFYFSMNASLSSESNFRECGIPIHFKIQLHLRTKLFTAFQWKVWIFQNLV